ncbi:hypothetical protein GCM10012319_59620 [Comamonas sp. KCTC 72670]|nr:hypothetical protein GCM10012319_59620 [Comamonas sp. KCTC 72670]
MPSDQLREGAPQRGHIQGARQLQGEGHVVDGLALLELREEPQSLLREGHRQRLGAARHRQQGRHGRARRLHHQRLDALRQPGERRRLEERPQRDLDAELRPDPRHQLRGQQGVAAELEEVVLRADSLHSEHLTEERRQLLLKQGQRGHVHLVRRP